MTYTITYRDKQGKVMLAEVEASDKAQAFFRFHYEFQNRYSWIIRIAGQ